MDCSILVTPKPGYQFIERSAAEKYFKIPYKNGEAVRVTFEKKDGSMRDMLCKRDLVMESQIKGIRSNYSPDHATVCEFCSTGRQWRKIDLNKIVEISI